MAVAMRQIKTIKRTAFRLSLYGEKLPMAGLVPQVILVYRLECFKPAGLATCMVRNTQLREGIWLMFKTDASIRRFIKSQVILFPDAPPKLVDEYNIYVWCVARDGYPKTFEQWLND